MDPAYFFGRLQTSAARRRISREQCEGDPMMIRHVTRMTIEDAGHYTPEQRATIIASYPLHERKARAQGIPALGSGRVFPIDEDELMVSAFDIPEHWMQ